MARMMAYAGHRLGINIGIVSQEASPALQVTAKTWIGNLKTHSLLDQISKTTDVVTIENEFIETSVLEYFESLNLLVHPSSKILSIIQDKFTQKTILRKAGIPIPRFAAVENTDEVLQCTQKFGWPLVLKARCNGYDGYGNELLRSREDICPAWEKLSKKSKLMVEEFVPFTKELAILAVRSSEGEEVTYPLVETIQHAHTCHTVLAPAKVSIATEQHAKEIAKQVMKTLEGVGIFGIEMFLLNELDILVNEIAPRPHNSGHFSIEGCITSQFENHVRAILGLPLGSTKLIAPAAAMVNLLGTTNGPANLQGLREALSISGANIHLYGKELSRPGRKMGHVTAVGQTIEAAREIALQAARYITI